MGNDSPVESGVHRAHTATEPNAAVAEGLGGVPSLSWGPKDGDRLMSSPIACRSALYRCVFTDVFVDAIKDCDLLNLDVSIGRSFRDNLTT